MLNYWKVFQLYYIYNYEQNSVVTPVFIATEFAIAPEKSIEINQITDDLEIF